MLDNSLNNLSDCNSKYFVNLDKSNKYTPIMWRNAKFEAPNKDGNIRVITVDLLINNEWLPYGLSLDDEYCPFEKEKVFQQIVDSGECKCYIPPSAEELLLIERQNMYVSRIQFKVQLAEMNLLDSVKNIMNNSNIKLKIIYDEATHFNRLSEIIEHIKNNLDLSDLDMDNIFREASKISV